MIVKLSEDSKTFFVPGFGYRLVKHLEEFASDNAFALELKKYFPHIVYTKKVQELEKDVIPKVNEAENESKTELLLEEPIQEAEKIVEEDKGVSTKAEDEIKEVVEEVEEKVKKLKK